MNHNTNLRKSFLRYLIPSIASLTSLSLYILADTYFVSVGVGSIGLAALNIALPAFSGLTALGYLIGVGSGVIYSVSRGSGNTERANRVCNTAVALCLVLGLILAVVFRLWSVEIALALGASAASVGFSAEYLRVIFTFAIFFLLNNVMNALIRNDENPKLAMVSMVTNSFANIVLDYLFVIRFGWGLWGAAVATCLSPITGLFILSLHFLKKHNHFHLELRTPDFRLIPMIARCGVANFITEMGNAVVMLLFNFTLIALSGDMAVAAYGIVANIAIVIGAIFVGVGQGMQPLASKLWGEGLRRDCSYVLRMALLIASVLGVVFFLTGQLLPHSLTAVFNSENNTQLASLVIPAIRLYFFSFLCMGINICSASYFQAVLRSGEAFLLSSLRGFVFIIPAVFLLPKFFGITGVWLVMPVVELLTMFPCIYFLFRTRAKKEPYEKNPL